ncbi:MAG: OmpH family outer membrane protein [Candidatus Xenobia bacterium]
MKNVKIPQRVLVVGALVLVMVVFGSVLSVRAAAGADKPPVMRVGLVNVLRVLGEMPEYRKKSEEYLQDRKKLFDVAGAKSNKDVQKILKSREPEIQAAQEKWEKVKLDFINDAEAKIRAASDKVMKDKGLSFVIMDSPWYSGGPLHQYGAEDITTDVLFAMQGK